jgi:hypothetical protein
VTELNRQVDARTYTSATTDVSDAKELKDARLGTVTKDRFGTLTIDVTLTNNSSRTSDYVGTVVFESPNGKTQYGDGTLFVEDLNPGQTKTSEVMLLDTLPEGAKKVVARPTDFDRTESF